MAAHASPSSEESVSERHDTVDEPVEGKDAMPYPDEEGNDLRGPDGER